MVGALNHRGPDEHGIHLDGDTGFGHARLSIIDISSGQQPMAECRRQRLRHLQRRNLQLHRAARGADRSAVITFEPIPTPRFILKLYEEKGIGLRLGLQRRFRLRDLGQARKRLMLARDRMGVRPLYYTSHAGGLYFASEVKALLTVPGVARRARSVRARPDLHLLVSARARAPRSRDIPELPPAHVLIAENGNVTVRPYWQLAFRDADDASLAAARPILPTSCACC